MVNWLLDLSVIANFVIPLILSN